MSISRIILIRHAHSQKNAEDRHGGQGRELTEQGRKELEKLHRYLKSQLCIKTPIIYHAPIAQAEFTAHYLNSSFSTIDHTDQRIRSLNLGILSGLSREEAATRYPGPAKRLEEWRNGNLRIEELNIPQSEVFHNFWERGVSFLEEMLLRRNYDGDLIIVGTRSILILLTNILLQDTFLVSKPYTVFEFNNCGVTVFRYLGQLKAELICQNETKFLDT
jgi:broad specificity phosphatase PhoE